jgi:ClpP class serine protease
MNFEHDLMLVCPRWEAMFATLTPAVITAEQRSQFAEHRRNEVARRARAKEDGSPLALTVVGDQAAITVHGLLTETPDIMSWWYGLPNTLYGDIADAIAWIERDKNVKHVTFDVESGGGTVAGLRVATQAIAGMKKGRSVSSSFAASAAFWISAEVGKIEAKHDLAEFGSIGVAVRMSKWEGIYDIASTAAPAKRPDPSTAEGQAIIRHELDAIHEKFAQAVATGRTRATGKQVTLTEVNGTYGQGGMILAEAALKVGMIDAIRTGAQATSGRGSVSGGTSNSGPSSKRKSMDAKQLKDEHRDTYDAVYRVGREAGLKEGEEATAKAVEQAIAAERKRVKAHLNFTKKKGANAGNILKIAHEAILNGAECDQLAMSEYATAENDAQALNDRESEDEQTPKPGASNPDPKGADLTDGVAAALKARRQKAGK